MKLHQLTTKLHENFNKQEPLMEYPRPQLRRDSYINLNGPWDYKISLKEKEPTVFDGDITVPYCVESFLSGVQAKLKKGQILIYRKRFSLSSDFNKGKVLLHIDGVDQTAKVYLNGYYLGASKNGYIPFTSDITNCLKEVNTLLIYVKDDLSPKYPYGKQKKKRGGMWYTTVSGIWKTVWLESVPLDYIRNIKITPLKTLNGIHLSIDSKASNFNITVYNKYNALFSKTTSDKEIDLIIDKPILWSPDNPYLYDLKIETNDDSITSYFALRTIELQGKDILLNGERIFCNGLLDQGYFPDGIYTPASYREYANDILTMKALGFNCLRKHLKVEPLYYYYLCDIYGMLVFQDMVNNSSYHFLEESALPTVLKDFKFNDASFNKNKESRLIFEQSMIDTVNLLYNHPCIILWTIFNEGWGQFNADKMHDKLLELDNTRLIDDTSGWFEQNKNMFKSIHCYYKKFELPLTDKPVLLTEFGGYSYKIKEHSFNLYKNYGYRTYKDQKAFEDGFVELYEQEIIPVKDKICGCIYTQVSDVEDETNGLFTYDRKILKVDKNRIIELMRKLK
ncbi:MAG: glycoside hydrolase family 2 [Bacilli bacterium]|nr:glycoside hydrolase family 2 [Bacilli bacterium]